MSPLRLHYRLRRSPRHCNRLSIAQSTDTPTSSYSILNHYRLSSFQAFASTTGTANSRADEGVQFLNSSNAGVGIRVSDTTNIAAQMKVSDTQSTPGTACMFTSVCKGSMPNPSHQSLGASWSFSQSAAYRSANPYYRLSLSTRGFNTETFENLSGFTVATGAITISTAALHTSIAAAVDVGAFN